jgi:predicted RNase H-like nuclease (RuvC/YqgF family)
MVEKIIQIQERQLYNSCPVSDSIKRYQRMVMDKDDELITYEREVRDLKSRIENLEGQLKEQVINKKEVEILRANSKNLEELLSSTRDALENVLYDL